MAQRHHFPLGRDPFGFGEFGHVEGRRIVALADNAFIKKVQHYGCGSGRDGGRCPDMESDRTEATVGADEFSRSFVSCGEGLGGLGHGCIGFSEDLAWRYGYAVFGSWQSVP